MLNLNVPKVSVIIPVYNVEKYIRRCVYSLLDQTLEDIEYIFVDDCTPDKSMEILRKMLTKYPNRIHQVKIVEHQVNRGLAAARNTGLKEATGVFTIHCDSDDWIEKDMYERMYLKALEEGAEIVGCDFWYEYPNRKKYCVQKYPIKSISCVSLQLSGKLYNFAWNKLVKRNLYLDNNIAFPDGVNMWEDVVTMVPLCFFAKKIAYIPRALYHYTQFNLESYTKAMNQSSLEDMISAIGLLDDFLKSNSSFLHFDRVFCNVKLTAKLNLLLNSSGEQQSSWNRLYREANIGILGYSSMSFYWRIALVFASLNFLPIFNLMVKIAKLIK